MKQAGIVAISDDGRPVMNSRVMRRAMELVGDVNYPPPETIRMISHLLAIQLPPPEGGPR